MRKHKGQTLIIVFFMLLVMGIIASSISALWQSEVKTRAQEVVSLTALYCAEAAVSKAQFELKNDWNWAGLDANNDNDPTGEKVTLDAGQYWVDITISGSNRLVEAHGWAGTDAHRVIRLELEQRIETHGAHTDTYYEKVPYSYYEKTD